MKKPIISLKELLENIEKDSSTHSNPVFHLVFLGEDGSPSVTYKINKILLPVLTEAMRTCIKLMEHKENV